MKKKYINPSIEVICCHMEQSILAGSDLKIDQSGSDYDAGSSYSAEREGYWENSEWE